MNQGDIVTKLMGASDHENPIPAPPVLPGPALPVVPPMLYKRSWKRLSLSIFSICVMIFVWLIATRYLYTLPEHSIAAFATITTSVFYTITLVVASLIGALSFFGWKINSNLESEVKSTIETVVGKTTKTEEKK